MYCTPVETRKAKKTHRCTSCGESINPGDEYKRWANYDGKAVQNKMHPECLSSLQEDSGGDAFVYPLYGGERPCHT